jgi:anti-sigma B factor antagonist
VTKVDKIPGAFDVTEEQLFPSGVVLAVSGELDMATAPELRERLDAALEAGVRRIVVDLQELTVLDSIALAMLLHASRRLGDEGRMAVVVAPDSYVRLIFEVAGMPHCVDVVESRAQAIARATA